MVCTSCSQGFESEASDEEEIECPACGQTQQASAAREAAEQGETTPDSEESAGDAESEDPFDGIEEEMVFDMDEEGEPSPTETADYGAVISEEAGEEEVAEPEASEPEASEEASEPEASEEASEPEASEEASEPEASADAEEDTRWRFRSGSGLVLFFPTYEVATKWVIKQNPADLSIAYGSGEFRAYSEFESLLKTMGDPMTAILAGAGSAESGAASVEDGVPQDADQEGSASTETVDPVSEVTPPSGEPSTQEKGSRPTTMTSEFQFRTGKDVNVWPGRILFLVLGLLLGGGGVYYAAWYGLLPGILY